MPFHPPLILALLSYVATPLCLCLCLSLTPSAKISDEASRVQTSFSIVPFPNGTIPAPATPLSIVCPTTLNYTLISQYRNIRPDDADGVYDAILWSRLRINGVDCLSPTQDQGLNSATYFTIPSPSSSSTGTTPLPWMLIGYDNSRLNCAQYQARYPAQHLFTDNLPRHQDYLIQQGLLPQGLVARPFREDIYLFMLFQSQDGIVTDPSVCVLRAGATLQQQQDAGVTGDADEDTPMSSPESDNGGPVCLSDRMHVQVMQSKHGWISLSVSQLKVGDVLPHPSGKGIDRVVSYSHRDSAMMATFYVIRTRGGHDIEATGGHYMYLANGAVKKAMDVRVGDELLSVTATGNKNNNVYGNGSVVYDLSTVRRRGVYAPMTMSGRVRLKNGKDGRDIVLSCYTDAVGDIGGHALSTPVRALWLFWGLEWEYVICAVFRIFY